MSELIDAAKALIAAMETCHQCQALLIVDDGPSRCEDSCSPDCSEHPEPDCPTIGELHGRLKLALNSEAELLP